MVLMPDIVVIDSESRQIDFETFSRELDGFSADRISLDEGHINVPIDETYDLTPYRGIYLRVGQVTEDVLARAENLEIVSTCGSGYDHVDVEAATQRNVLVTHTPEAPAPGAIEHTFGFIFSLLSELPEMFSRTRNGNWGEGQTVVNELHDRTIGVVGLGTIGFEVAKIARMSFNANVVAYDPYVTGTAESASNIYPRVQRAEVESHGITLVDKRELFEEASIVTLHVPLTESTRKMVSTRELEALGEGYLVNISRGSVVDEQALHAAIKGGQLKGAALDVLESEPPNPSNPLLHHPDVLVSPHIAGGKEGYTKRSAEINADRIATTLRGNWPAQVVNPEVKDEKYCF